MRGYPGTSSPHGTVSRYQHQGCRCNPCRQAAVTTRAAQRESRRLAQVAAREHGQRYVAPVAVHGKSTYENHYCRCETCTEYKRVADLGRPRRGKS